MSGQATLWLSCTANKPLQKPCESGIPRQFTADQGIWEGLSFVKAQIAVGYSSQDSIIVLVIHFESTPCSSGNYMAVRS